MNTLLKRAVHITRQNHIFGSSTSLIQFQPLPKPQQRAKELTFIHPAQLVPLGQTWSRSLSTFPIAMAPVQGSASPVTPVDSKSELVLDSIPDKPSPLGIREGVDAVMQEPSLSELGLASWWPTGRMQLFLENIHIGLDLPWWVAIAALTTVLRVLCFPFIIMSQKNMAKMAVVQPEMKKLQKEINDSKARGDHYETMRLQQEMLGLSKKHDFNPFKNMIQILVQAPIFASMFLGIRGMTNLPVESMTTGGILWFQDLTVADPYYGLPIIVGLTMALQIKLSTEGINVNQLGPVMKKAIYCLPLFLTVFSIKLPAAILVYWTSTNIISVIQSQMIRTPKVRQVLNMPEFKVEVPAEKEKKSFREAVREMTDNWRAGRAVMDTRATDEQIFREAGQSKTQRTYRFDPTKPRIVRKS